MPTSRSFFALLACLLVWCLFTSGQSNFAVAQTSDEIKAERVLGPHWRELSRRAGAIFAGRLLSVSPPTADSQADGRAISSVKLCFRVDRAIAGVEPGQTLTVHEWSGALSAQLPMRAGQRILLFLYPPSRLGLTSPVGGPLGQVVLDASGKQVVDRMRAAVVGGSMRSGARSASRSEGRTHAQSVTVTQLERAIRGAREE